jgi:hypothetical protein
MRYWTVEEARAELPRVRLLVDVLRRAAHQATVAQRNGHGTLAGAGPARRVPGEAGVEGGEGGADRATGEAPVPIAVESALAELGAKGIVLRDPETGLVDFPAITGRGVVYLLCWKRDEADLGWWHFAEEGVAGRKPLPIPPDL